MLDKADKPQIKGWCPGAWHPMASGDGLLVRVRLSLGRLTREQMLALCAAAETFGSGLIELTSRANLQLRGVSEADWPALMDCLVEHQLVDPDPHGERRPQLMLAPDWQAGDATHEAARLLLDRPTWPELPAKWGIAIDAGEAPLLDDASADLRIERSVEGTLLVRADGRELGTPVDSPAAAVELLVRLAHWFVESGGRDAGRMRRHTAPLPAWAPGVMAPAVPGLRLALGPYFEEGKGAWGRVVGLPFGRAPAAALRAAVEPASVNAVRVTPWRRLLIEGEAPPAVPGLLDDDRDPRLCVDVCPGAPHCEQASVETLALAERLSGRIEGSVHVSGCAKGCARQTPADLCLSGRDGRFDLIVGGRADGAAVATGLDESEALEMVSRRWAR